MRENLDKLMSKYQADDYTVRMCNAVFTVVPFAPKYQHWAGLDDAVRAVSPGAGADVLQRARAIATSEDVEKALWIADSLDTGDKGIAIYSGVKSAFGLFFASDKKNVFESDPQQAADAALKALGMAYMIHKLYPGSVGEKVEAFKSSEAGKALALYFATVEVAVPFTDNVLTGGGEVISKLMDRSGNETTARLAKLAGGAAATEATGVLAQLKGSLEGITSKVVQYVGPVAEKVKGYLPGILNTTDKVAGAVATGADLMPVWGLLGSRLAAEAAAMRAVKGR